MALFVCLRLLGNIWCDLKHQNKQRSTNTYLRETDKNHSATYDILMDRIQKRVASAPLAAVLKSKHGSPPKAFSKGPGGFRKVREADRNKVH